ncbi:hypothetical protein K435DRAFT_514836 [Dendrothele bispora CBS 962.96]|uniref:Uncharacterized protein n=1 Tax=Dendrothele bispora (strain CBS 962.96) TaxID=1314807 RepID=A0A4S8M9C5_DENBC|nr:hypothetical protein K435DRAFT_514836 [Dendrothele bispora CBS 962.96]
MRAFSLLAAFTSVAVTFAAPIDLGQVAGTATHLVDSTAGTDLTGTVNGVVGKVNGVISTVNGVAAPVVEKVDGLTGGIVHSRDTLTDGALSPVVEKVTGVTGTVHQVAGSALGTVHDAIPSEVTDVVGSVVEKVDLSKVTGGLRRSSDAELGNELSNDLLSFANNVHVSGRDLDLKEATDSVSELTHPEVDPKPDVDVKVVSRCDCTTVPNILNDVTDQLKPILQQISMCFSSLYPPFSLPRQIFPLTNSLSSFLALQLPSTSKPAPSPPSPPSSPKSKPSSPPPPPNSALSTLPNL